jgi:hypothetical protein
VFRRFGLDGFVQNSRIGGADDEELLAKTVALLGDNGWELVSVTSELQPGASFSGARWVFKRPIIGGAYEADAPTGESFPSAVASEATAQDDHTATPQPAATEAAVDRDPAPGTAAEEAAEPGQLIDQLGSGEDVEPIA